MNILLEAISLQKKSYLLCLFHCGRRPPAQGDHTNAWSLSADCIVLDVVGDHLPKATALTRGRSGQNPLYLMLAYSCFILACNGDCFCKLVSHFLVPLYFSAKCNFFFTAKSAVSRAQIPFLSWHMPIQLLHLLNVSVFSFNVYFIHLPLITKKANSLPST